MNRSHQVDPKEEEIQHLLTLDRVLNLGVVLDQTRQQRTIVKKLHQTTSPVTKLRAESLLRSKSSVYFHGYLRTWDALLLCYYIIVVIHLSHRELKLRRSVFQGKRIILEHSPLLISQDEFPEWEEELHAKEESTKVFFFRWRGQWQKEAGVCGPKASGHGQHQLQGGRGAENWLGWLGGSSGWRRPPARGGWVWNPRESDGQQNWKEKRYNSLNKSRAEDSCIQQT